MIQIKNSLTHYPLALLALFIATICWGSTFSMGKILVEHLTPYSILTLRSLFTSLLLLVLFYKTLKRDFFVAMRTPLLWVFCFVNFLGLIFQTIGLQYTSATNSGFITAFSIVLVPFIKKLHFKGELSPFILIGAGLALVGIYFISFGFGLPEALNRGDFFTLLCAFAYGYFIVILEQLLKRVKGPTVMFFSFAFTGILSFIWSIESFELLQLSIYTNTSIMGNLLALTILGGVIPYLLMVHGQRIVKAEVASMVYSFEPVFAALVAYLLLGEQMTQLQYWGGFLLLTSLTITIYGDRKVK